MSTDTLLPQLPERRTSAYEATFVCDWSGVDVPYRLLCSYDLAAVAGTSDASAAQDQLTTRAIIALPPALDATPDLLDAVADAIVTTDPLADIRLGFTCAACAHAWTSSFDIVSFLWAEVDAEVRRLFDDVHRLGSVYGWSEAVVLTMSSQRRHEYLTRAS